MLKRVGITTAFIGAVMWAVATPARANAILDFRTGLAGSGGTITQSGSNYIGTGIEIDSLLVLGTASGNGRYDVDGTAVDELADGGTAGVLDFNTATGAFSVTGSLPTLGIKLQTLLSGFISSFTFGPAGENFEFRAQGTDTKSAELLSALGLDPATPFVFNGFSIAMAEDEESAGTYTAFSTDIANTAVPVPEPATMMLLGSGLLAVAGAVRRRSKKASA